MIPQLQKIFHSITKSLEVLYVIEGTKPCARILVHEDEIEKITGFLKENKLQTSISDFKVIKQNVWIPVGYPEDIETAERFLRKH